MQQGRELQAWYANCKQLLFHADLLLWVNFRRRAHENSAIMGAAVTKQLEMLKLELLRRMKNPLARGGLLKRSNGSAIPHSA